MKSQISNLKSQILTRGQSLFELVVAIAISALIIVVLVSLVSNSIRNATFSKNTAQASSYAQEATEWLRAQRDNNIAVFVTNTTTPVWCFRSLAWTESGACGDTDLIANTIFIREATFTTSLVGGKTLINADVSVSWTDAQGVHTVTSATSYTDWRQR